jgi:hypothetical protein
LCTHDFEIEDVNRSDSTQSKKKTYLIQSPCVCQLSFFFFFKFVYTHIRSVHALALGSQRGQIRNTLGIQEGAQSVLQWQKALVKPLREFLQPHPLPPLAFVGFHVLQRRGICSQSCAGDERDVVLSRRIENVLRYADCVCA